MVMGLEARVPSAALFRLRLCFNLTSALHSIYLLHHASCPRFDCQYRQVGLLARLIFAPGRILRDNQYHHIIAVVTIDPALCAGHLQVRCTTKSVCSACALIRTVISLPLRILENDKSLRLDLEYSIFV